MHRVPRSPPPPVNPMSDYRYRSETPHDAEEHAASLSAWDQRYEQISAGRYDAQIEDLCVGPVQVFRETTQQALLQSGRPRPGSFTVALTRAEQAGAWFCGHRLDRSRTIAVSSSGEFEFVSAPGTTLLAVCIDTDCLDAHAARVQPGTAPQPRPASAVLELGAERQRELQELLDAAMLLARDQPALLAQPALRRTLTQSMADAVLGSLSPGAWQTQVAPGAGARQRIVRQARAHMQAHADEVITVPDLCVATGSSRRALQYAFEDVLHVGPVAYLRMMRLNRVRHDLLARGDTSVGDIAARWGFWHLSRFAADYRALFGELPSATRARLRRTADD